MDRVLLMQGAQARNNITNVEADQCGRAEGGGNHAWTRYGTIAPSVKTSLDSDLPHSIIILWPWT